MRPKIIAFVLAYRDPPLPTLISLAKQTWRPNKVVIVAAYESACKHKVNILTECLVVPPDMNLTVGERVGKALTIAFNKWDFTKYDYLIKLDDDVMFGSEFLEKNIKYCMENNIDLMGRGAAMIIKTSRYYKLLNKRWPISSTDDSFVYTIFIANKCKTLPFRWFYPANLIKEPSKDLRRAWLSGIEKYKLGVCFMSLLFNVIGALRHTPRRGVLGIIMHLVSLLGYIYGKIRRLEQYPESKTISEFYRKEYIPHILGKFKYLIP